MSSHMSTDKKHVLTEVEVYQRWIALNIDRKHVLTEVEVNKRWRAFWKISSFFCKMCYPLKIKTIVNLLLLLLTLILRGRDNLKMYSHMNTDKKHVLIEVEIDQRWRAL